MKSSVSILVASTALAFANVGFAAGKTVSLEELKKSCFDHQDGGQLRPGNIEFQCTQSSTFWVSEPNKELELPNYKRVCFSMDLKDKAWEAAPVSKHTALESDVGKCDDLVQMESSVSISRYGSCELVAAIVDAGGEQAYCEAQMDEDGVTADFAAVVQEMQERPSHISDIARTASVAEPVKTGKKRLCNLGCKKDKCDDPGKGPSKEPKWGSSSSSSSSYKGLPYEVRYKNQMNITDRGPTSHQKSTPANVKLAEKALGAGLRAVTVKKRFDHKYEGVRVLTCPKPGSVLDKMGVLKDDVILKFDGDHIKSICELNMRFTSLKSQARSCKKKVKAELKVRRIVDGVMKEVELKKPV